MSERNQPCPCGSGRKYKHCCLRAEEARRQAQTIDLGPRTALAWISQRFRRQAEAAVDDGFFAELDPIDVSEAMTELGPAYAEMLQINIADYVLSEALFERGGEEGRGIDWVIGRGGPRLSGAQRRFLEALSDAPLRLYEVVESRPGEGLQLRDVLDPERSPAFVRERSASTRLARGDMIGTRVLRFDDHNELGGATYPLDRMVAAGVIERVERFMDADDGEDAVDFAQDPEQPLAPELEALVQSEIEREETAEEEAEKAAIAAAIEDEEVALAIREAWLRSLLFPRIPEIVDSTSGAPMMLIEDDYDVHDRAALVRALSECSDVSGDAHQGWTRVDDPDAEISRTLTTINTTDSPDRVMLFHRTQAGAEAGGEWFERVAAGAVVRGARRVTDPREAMLAQRRTARIPEDEDEDDDVSELSPGQLGDVIGEFLRKHYANWCDEPIPALDNRTPRECLVDARGRESVRYLLRTYENGERHQAAMQKRAPISFDFLWEQLGLAREE